MPAADSNKFITNSLPEFLLLLSQSPETVFTMDPVMLRDFHTVIVCYDAHVFYRNLGDVDGPTVGLDEFVLYCDSKIQPQLIDNDESSGYVYRCLMTVSDLIRTEPWARLYDIVGTRIMRRLLFDCLLFVPLGRHVYYCVRSPSQHAGRYEVLQAFRVRAGSRWTPKLPPPPPRKYFNFAGLLRDVQPIGRQDSSDMLRSILQTDVIGTIAGRPTDVGTACLDQLVRKLKVMAEKDTSRTYWNIYQDVVGDCASAEVPLGRVKSFARTVVRKIVPQELFGTAGNRDQFCDNLCQVLNGGKFHDYTVQHVVHKIKMKKFKWLNGVAEDRRTEIATKTLVWLINEFVFGRIVHCFQIVMTTTPNNGVVYMVKAKWANMCREKISPLMADGSEFFKQIQPNPLEPSSSSYRNWKVCPYAKPNGVRLIFKLRLKEGINEKRLTDDCLTFLRCLSRSQPLEYRSLTRPQFFREWKALQESRGGATLYFVRTDFRDAFTSFMHDKLRTVVRDRIKERFGKKQKTVAVHTVDEVKIGGGSTVYCKKRRYVGGLPTPEFQGGSLVFHDKTDVVPLFRIWDTVRRCIGCNVVERGGLRRVMTRGVVQGDRLSVALCDLLLADLHAQRLTDLVDSSSGCRLFRFVDDYLFVSPDRDSARRYLAAMHAGFDEYGLRLNRSKTETNLDDKGGSGRTVKFLGFRLNAATGEVTKDASACRNRRPLHFFDYGLGRGRPGRSLYAKVSRPGWHHMPIVLVSKSFNSVATVAQNVASVVAYKAFAVITAVKQYFFHLNPSFLVNTVRAVARIVYANARASVRHSAVTAMQCKWIVYEVYATMFRAHFSPDDVRVASVVHQIRCAQTSVGRKCVTRVLRAALRHRDFAKMFS
ncbi:telomerase reverse transcriptase-like [Melanaphis sacchari]|uniref:telomerase reverse transcriptase-like n=1 Tax=Melanaphis sacchari TaxID=742174 RepID=UPI000DC1307F|nr:telomerase reverse transcriptase-like [Melanaphis sacchari]